MNVKSTQVNSNVTFNTVECQQTIVAISEPEPTNHILVIDCSGSMYHDLPSIRKQLKNKLPSLVKENDTVSIIWFSGRGECGILQKRVKVANITDLQHLNDAIDRWLKPVCLTGFKEPLEQALEICTEEEGVYSLFFLTDGYDNQWSKSEILGAVANIKDYVASATFVEYGWYCNRALMSEMAEEMGGSLIFCEDFDSYDPIVSASLSHSLMSAKKIEVEVVNPLHNLVFTINDEGQPCTYKVNNGVVKVPEYTKEVYYYNEIKASDELKNVTDIDSLKPIYVSVAILSQRMESKTIYQILSGLGDVKVFNKYANCFGKQNNTDFQSMTLTAASTGIMFEDGRDFNLEIDPNAFTLIDFLNLIMDDKDNKLVPSKMKYKRIGRGTLDATEDLTSEEQAEISVLSSKAKTASELKAVANRLNEILVNKPKKLSFVKDTPDASYPVMNLTWNETRPNVSILIKYDGSIELPSDADCVKNGKLPSTFKSFIFRNYTIIKDGIANIDELPLQLAKTSFLALKGVGMVEGNYNPDEVYMVNLRNLPTINQSMVTNVSANNLFTLQYELLKLKANQKMYKAFEEQWFGKAVSENFVTLYGEDVTLWLKEQGITERGFAPKTKKADVKDTYMGVELKVSMKGLSSIPSFNAFEKKIIAGKKLTASDSLLEVSYEDCKAYFKQVENESNKDELLKEWVKEKKEDSIIATRKAIKAMAELKFGVIIGQVWFDEFDSMEDNTLDLSFDGRDFACKVEMKDKEFEV